MNKEKNQDALFIEKLINTPELWASPDIPYIPYGEGKEKLSFYLNFLLKWNKSLNLCGFNSPLQVLRELIQDSFFLSYFLDRLDYSSGHPIIWDLGAGAGLPGIPLRIFWNKGQYTWVELNQKRAIFLCNIQAQLKLSSFQGYCGRVEDFFYKNKEKKADLIISRAFRPWKEILELCNTKLSPKGKIIIMANESPVDMPEGWMLDSLFSYNIASKTRFLWAISSLS